MLSTECAGQKGIRYLTIIPPIMIRFPWSSYSDVVVFVCLFALFFCCCCSYFALSKETYIAKKKANKSYAPIGNVIGELQLPSQGQQG